jgi:hypothetical protein
VLFLAAAAGDETNDKTIGMPSASTPIGWNWPSSCLAKKNAR